VDEHGKMWCNSAETCEGKGRARRFLLCGAMVVAFMLPGFYQKFSESTSMMS
jgi:hypothetical protein